MAEQAKQNELMMERRARLAAERLLEQKSGELIAANRKLSAHAMSLSGQIVDQRRVVEALEGENTKVSQDLEAANHKVVAVERLLWDAVDTIKDGFALFDSNLNLIVANPPYLAGLEGAGNIGPGSSFAEILDVCVDEGIVDLQGAKVDDWLDMMLDRWAGDKIEPVTLRFWNGVYVKLMDRRTSDGGIVSMALNITDNILREEELREARDKAQAADRAKSAFLAKMSHELRTPMNGVVGMADLLVENGLDEESNLYAQTIRNSGMALLDIINDVLDFSKIEADKLVLKHKPFDLERLVQDVGLIVEPTVQHKGLNFQIDYDQFLPAEFVGDAGRIRQILTNLVGNAVKFTEHGYVLVRVVGVMSDDATTCQIHITVEDSGIGVEANMAAHIFGDFNQIEEDANRKYEGTGLGLAITHKLVDQMDGEIWMSSEKGEGSCFGFRIKLPVVSGTQSLPQPLSSSLKQALIIESNQMDLDVLTRQLNLLGLNTAVSPSVKQAISRARAGVDIIFLGHCVEELGAMEQLQAAYAESPIILMLDPGAPDPAGSKMRILRKPFQRPELHDCLNSSAQGAPDPEPHRILRILAAEDNKTNQLVFRKMLKSITHDLTMVNDGREAVEAFLTGEFDLVFTDISMPDMDGMEASRRIRTFEAENGLEPCPIIAMTAHAMDGDEARIREAGVSHYLTKPLKTAQIIELVEELAPDCTKPLKAEENPG